MMNGNEYVISAIEILHLALASGVLIFRPLLEGLGGYYRWTRGYLGISI